MTTERSLATWEAAPNQLLAAELLGRGGTRTEAAAAAKVIPRTIYNWLTVTQFQELVMEFNREWRAEFAAKAAKLAERALEIEQLNLGEKSTLRPELRAQLAHDIVVRTQYR